MNAGIDFGTSNCALGYLEENKTVLLNLQENSRTLESVWFTLKQERKVYNIDERDLNVRVGVASRGKKYSDEQKKKLRERIAKTMRRELDEKSKADYAKQSLSSVLDFKSDTYFGREAIKRNQNNPGDGIFATSPKSFLGSNISKAYLNQYQSMIKKMLSHMRLKYEQNTNGYLENTVIGRPINFSRIGGKESNEQAISILKNAAIDAGFRNVEFLFEPIAAALDFETSLSEDKILLVLDFGGGTTDFSMIKVGPSYRHLLDRQESILGNAGKRIGGIDFDISLSEETLLEKMGYGSVLNNGMPIPNKLVRNSMQVNDLPRLNEFYGRASGQEIRRMLQNCFEPEKLNRLLKVHEERLAERAILDIESGKKQLSSSSNVDLNFGYIEEDFYLPISLGDLERAFRNISRTFDEILSEVMSQASVHPDVVFVTGGTARSEVVKGWIDSRITGADIVYGDSFCSVASGLANWANRIFK